MFCPESMKTLSVVKACPLNEKDWLSAAKKMKCESKNQTCCPKEDYKYHCLVNVFQNVTFQLCAPRIRLNYCPQYNDYGARVQINFNANCTDTSTDCGKFYDSNKAYEMPNCFKLKSEENNIVADEKTPDEEISRSYLIGVVIGISFIITILILTLMWKCKVFKRKVCDFMKCNDSGENHVLQFEMVEMIRRQNA
ncbi:uncharacterized protein LOC134276986 [Saccostrea cucullata]|uniref:uncharacterized protein LOC134276986 n=1 Tax=Saccostrea cuccullata TaxID=36930 RepID=UPI002ED3538B